MHELIIDINGDAKLYPFPSEFEEFERKHLLAFSDYIQGATREIGTAYPEFVVRFMNIPRKIWKQLSPEDMFWAEVIDDKVVFHPELQYLSKPYINKASVLKRVGLFRGPSDNLGNLTLEQVGFTSGFASKFADSQNPEDLTLFFAALYRLPFFQFNRKMIGVNKFFARLVSPRLKRAALLNYRGLMEANRLNYKHVYQGGKSDGTERFAYEGTIQRLAKTGVFGSYNEAKRTLFPQAMILFEMNGIEIKRQKDEIKRSKSQKI